MRRAAASVHALAVCLAAMLGAPASAQSVRPSASTASSAESLDSAYAAQRALVAARLKGDRVAGYKAGFTLPAVQRSLGLSGPALGVLFAKGSVPPSTSFAVNPARALIIEAEFGFTIGRRIARPITDPAQLRNLVAQVQPVIELPELDPAVSAPTGRDKIAMNIGSERFIKGSPFDKATRFGAAYAPRLYLDGKLVAEANPDMVAQDPWVTLQFMVNKALELYGPVERGQLFIAGSLIQYQHKQPGSYRADYGPLGQISFEAR
jgi:2-keto-4-pentenoate hydratase